MDALDALLARLARRQRLQRLIAVCVPPLVAGVLVSSTWIAVVRTTWPEAAWTVTAAAGAAFLIPLCWLPTVVRQRPTRARLAAEVDLLAGAHGLAMATAEQRDAAWMARLSPLLASVVLPAAGWRRLMPALAATCLLAGALALPQALLPPPPAANPAAALVRPLREELAAMTAAAVVTPEERQELERRLDELVEQAPNGLLDQATWQAVDGVQARLDAQATAAGEKLAAALAAAQDAVAHAEGASPTDAGSAANPASTAQATALAADLARTLAALAEQAPGLLPSKPGDPAAQQALAQALAQAEAQGRITPAQRAALAKAGFTPAKPGKQGGVSASQARALGRHLAQELAKRRAGLGTCRSATAAEAFLARLRAGQGLRPGQGRVVRGPGAAPLDHESRPRTAGGEQTGLPPGMTLNPDGSVTVAAQSRDAERDPAADREAQRAAAQHFDPAAADARRATVAPRHREAVERFFGSGERGAGSGVTAPR